MSVYDKNLYGYSKYDSAIEILKMYEPSEGYYVAFSGGKDSITILDLVKKSGVKYDAHFNLTSVDPPELLKFIKENYPDVKWHKPEISMYNLIIKKKMPPTRIARYCCSELKEKGGSGRFVITGVRSEESVKRARRKQVETCYKHKNTRYLHVIFDWTTEEVFEYLHENNIKWPLLYNTQKRIGCIGCPMGGKKGMEYNFNKWPNFKKMYIAAFGEMIKNRLANNMPCEWKTGEDVFNWWVYGNKEEEEEETLFQ